MHRSKGHMTRRDRCRSTVIAQSVYNLACLEHKRTYKVLGIPVLIFTERLKCTLTRGREQNSKVRAAVTTTLWRWLHPVLLWFVGSWPDFKESLHDLFHVLGRLLKYLLSKGHGPGVLF